ncbi:MAG: hypothetical protein ACRD0A_04055 [Acidimicrobiales bacterium]
MSGDFDSSNETYEQSEPIDPGERPPREPAAPPAEGQGIAGFVVGAIVAAALVTFGFQNTRSVPLRFLWFDGTVPLWIAMGAAALGAVVVMVTLLGGAARKRRRQRKRAARAAPG